MYKITPELAELMLTALKDAMDGGFIYFFSGSVPAEATDALDMVADHTQLAMLSIGNDGVTGLTFDTVAGAVVAKVPADVWRGTNDFDGTEDAEATLPPTFIRFGAVGDNCRGEATGPRIQAEAGGPSSGKTILVGADTITDNGTNTTTMSIFNIRLY